MMTNLLRWPGALAALVFSTACATTPPPAPAPAAAPAPPTDHEPAAYAGHHHGHHGAGPHDGAAAGHHGGHQGHFERRFQGAEEWAKVFDAPDRDGWQRPAEVVAALALPPGARVADLGAGTGYFATRLARAVPAGLVYAVDLEDDMVAYLGQRAAREGLKNLRPVRGAADDPHLPEAVDLILVVDTYHHIAARPRFFAALSSRLRPGGRLAIIDFKRESPMGPPPEHRIPPQTVAAELAEAGYRQVQDHALLEHQYFLVFQRR